MFKPVLDKLSSRPIPLLLATVVASTAAGYGAGSVPLDPELVHKFFSETSQNQIAQAGFFFTIAAWLHSGRVKKEIKANFEALTTAIEKVADAFREDLQRHADRLDNISTRVTTLEEKIIIIHNKE